MDPQQSAEAVADIQMRVARARNIAADCPCKSNNETPLNVHIYRSSNNSQADSLSRGVLGNYTV